MNDESLLPQATVGSMEVNQSIVGRDGHGSIWNL